MVTAAVLSDLHFGRMHGAGNDVVVQDLRDTALRDAALRDAALRDAAATSRPCGNGVTSPALVPPFWIAA